MKNTYIVVVLIALALIGYLFFIKSPAQIETPRTEESTASGKLDINVVCEGVLAYMSFPSGEEAAKFVAECKEGKHPEIIEKYKADMNLGDGATI